MRLLIKFPKPRLTLYVPHVFVSEMAYRRLRAGESRMRRITSRPARGRAGRDGADGSGRTRLADRSAQVICP